MEISLKEQSPKSPGGRESKVYSEPEEDQTGYLTPNQTPSSDSISSPFSLKKPKIFTRVNGNKRVDSGISSDGESTTLSPTASLTTPLGMNEKPFQYDYADQQYQHQYEELPGGRRSTYLTPSVEKQQLKNDLHSSSGTNTTETFSDVDDTSSIIKGDMPRKRVNPLYETVAQSVHSVYSKKLKSSDDVKIGRQYRCIRCCVLLLFLFSCCALALSLYALVTVIKSKDEAKESEITTAELKKQLSDLQRKYQTIELILATSGLNTSSQELDKLLSRVTTIEDTMSSEFSNLKTQYVETHVELNKSGQAIEAIGDDFRNQLNEFRDEVDIKLFNISKMEGPQGPSGVGNLSACYYTNATSVEVAGSSPLTPPWSPTDAILKHEIVMFASCSVEGGSSHVMEYNAINPNTVKYRCLCKGIDDVTGDKWRRCTTHLWLCPRES